MDISDLTLIKADTVNFKRTLVYFCYPKSSDIDSLFFVNITEQGMTFEENGVSQERFLLECNINIRSFTKNIYPLSFKQSSKDSIDTSTSYYQDIDQVSTLSHNDIIAYIFDKAKLVDTVQDIRKVPNTLISKLGILVKDLNTPEKFDTEYSLFSKSAISVNDILNSISIYESNRSTKIFTGNINMSLSEKLLSFYESIATTNIKGKKIATPEEEALIKKHIPSYPNVVLVTSEDEDADDYDGEDYFGDIVDSASKKETLLEKGDRTLDLGKFKGVTVLNLSYGTFEAFILDAKDANKVL